MNLQLWLFASFFWFFYQCYVVILLGFVFEYHQFFYGAIFATAMMLGFGSMYSVVYVRPPPLPSKYRISNDVDLKSLSLDELERLRKKLIKSSGANEFHAKFV